MPECDECEIRMRHIDTYREYVSMNRFKEIRAYRCPNCGTEQHEEESETIA